jgi:hypothetical protein
MGKPMVAYAVTVLHTRPAYPGRTEFLKIYRIKSNGDPETLRDMFTRAFTEAHPDWQIKQVNVDKE